MLVIQWRSIPWSRVLGSEAAALDQGGRHVDLLEYMRSQNNMTQAEWERRFEDAARELLVLLAGSGGARECNGFGDPRGRV